MKKYIFMVVFALVFALAVPCSVSAAEASKKMLNGANALFDGLDNYIVLEKYDGTFWLVANFDGTGDCFEYGSYYGQRCLSSPTFGTISLYQWNSEEWVLYQAVTQVNGVLETDWSNHSFTVLYSSLDIVYRYTEGDKAGTVFFRATPLRAELSNLAKIVELSTRQKTPMFQVISLLPLAISLVVSFLALRKCLTLLSTLLRQG